MIILNSPEYIISNESITSYICKLFPKVKNHVVHPLIKIYTCNAPCTCNLLTNNCAEEQIGK